MLKWKWYGIEFSVSMLFFAALVVMFTVDTSSFPLWCVSASAMHEAGHFIAIYALGHKPLSVRVGIFGVCVTQNPGLSVSYKGNAFISLAGPLVNLVSFAVIYFTSGFTPPAMIHLVLGAFNILPVESLDGGQAISAFLLHYTGKKTADMIGMALSVLTLIPIMTAGFLILIRSGYNFTLLAVGAYLTLTLIFKKR